MDHVRTLDAILRFVRDFGLHMIKNTHTVRERKEDSDADFDLKAFLLHSHTHTMLALAIWADSGWHGVSLCVCNCSFTNITKQYQMVVND